jgi:hypothetical protein
MTILGINVIALVLGLVLLAPRRDGRGHLWRSAREMARSESGTNANSVHVKRKLRFGLAAGAISLPVEGAAISAGANAGVRNEARLLRRINGPGPEAMRRS